MLTVRGKKVVALGGSLPEKIWMVRVRVRGCDRRPQEKKNQGSGGICDEMEGGLGGAMWRGRWRRALAQSRHVGEDSVGVPGSRQGARPTEYVTGRASGT
jgi:hypothetical protein